MGDCRGGDHNGPTSWAGGGHADQTTAEGEDGAAFVHTEQSLQADQGVDTAAGHAVPGLADGVDHRQASGDVALQVGAGQQREIADSRRFGCGGEDWLLG